jgi:hypothetical protein
MRDVTDLFHVTDIDPHELTQHLISTFHRGAFSALDRIDIPDADEPELQIYFRPNGQIFKIDTSLTVEKLQPVITKLERLFLSPTRQKVHRFIGFADSPVTGTWECEAFTITAAPPEAPRPQQLLADHPYILEVSFDAADDGFVNMQRVSRLRGRYELLLSLFVPGIRTTRNGLDTMWGIDIGNRQPGEPTPHLVQSFYSIPGFQAVADNRTPLADPLIALIPDTEYFNRRGRRVDHDLDLPQSLQTWVDAALACEEQLSKQLLRSAYWLRHAYDVFQLSQSASLVAAVQAVEALLPTTKGQVCSTCNREIGPGPTQKFKNFLQQYVPTTSKEELKARSLLYRQRSQLTHGRELLTSDSDHHFGWTNPAHAFDRQTLDDALRLARICAINWFSDRIGLTAG